MTTRAPAVLTKWPYNSVIPITITNYHVWSLIIDQYTDMTITNIIILVATIPSCIPTFGGTTRYLTISQSDTISSQIISHEQHLNWHFRITMLRAQVRDTHLIKTLVTKKAPLTLCILWISKLITFVAILIWNIIHIPVSSTYNDTRFVIQRDVGMCQQLSTKRCFGNLCDVFNTSTKILVWTTEWEIIMIVLTLFRLFYLS